MKKWTAAFVLVVMVPVITLSQQIPGNHNSLLWRITGKNMTHPSYLFGTMHLTDKRIFNFTDSLYHFVETTDGFAAELNMEEVMPLVLTDISASNESEKLLVNYISKDSLNPYKSRLESTLKMPLNQITISDLKKAGRRFMSQQIKNGEMNTIIDMYLFDIARRQGKWVGGIEDLEDQYKKDDDNNTPLSLVKAAIENPEFIRKQLDRMIKIYLNQDLDALDLSNTLWKGAETYVLNRRNNKMARRIDSIMNIRSCFFAVGAAHLPGDSGVINFLRKRGFSVEPVFSTKTIAPSQYHFVEKELPWVESNIKDNWYTILMPGKANDMIVGDNAELHMQMFVDLSKMNAFFTLGTPIVKGRIGNDSMYRVLAKSYSTKGSIVGEKTITLNGDTGREFMVKADEMDMRLQIFLPNAAAIIVNGMSAYKYDSLSGRDAERFFGSFHMLKDPPPMPAVSWKKYSFPQHAFSINFPTAFKEQKRDTTPDSIWHTRLYISNAVHDSVEVSCGIMVMEAKSGYYSDNDSTYFELMKKNVLASTKGKIIQSGPDSFKGFPAYTFNITMDYSGTPLITDVKEINRGNRRYYIYSVHTKSELAQTEADKYLNSFDFLPIVSQNWQYQPSPTSDISIWAPAPLQLQNNLATGNTLSGYNLYDSLSPLTVIVNREILSPYSWWKSDSSFFRLQADRFVLDEKDSIEQFQLNKNGLINGAEFYVVSPNNHNVKKVSLFVIADTLYYLSGHLPLALLQDTNYKRLFTDTRFSVNKATNFHLSDKTARILNDIAMGDSTSFALAGKALKSANFTIADLPLLQKALLQPYRDFSPFLSSIHDNLIEKVLKLDNGTTCEFIKNNYSSLKDSSEILQPSFLSILLRLKTTASFELFRQIIEKHIPVKGDLKMLRYSLIDSLQLGATIFPTLLSLSADSNIVRLLPDMGDKLLDSNLVSIASIAPYKKYFYAFAEKEIQRVKNKDAQYDNIDEKCINLLSHFKEQSSYDLMRKFYSSHYISDKMSVTMTLLNNNQKADASQLEMIAADNYYRITLYDDLKEIGKEKLFPSNYLNQRSFAKSDIYNSMDDDENTIDSILFISENQAKFQGKTFKFYLYKVNYTTENDEPISSLGIAGPYPIVPGKIITSSRIAGLYNDQPYDSKKINQQFHDYLKQWEKYLENSKKQPENN